MDHGTQGVRKVDTNVFTGTTSQEHAGQVEVTFEQLFAGGRLADVDTGLFASSLATVSSAAKRTASEKRRMPTDADEVFPRRAVVQFIQGQAAEAERRGENAERRGVAARLKL